MTLYELIFILLFLASVIGLLLSAFLRRKPASNNIWIALASVWGVYLAILAVSDLRSAQRVFKPGEEQCFDEMCFAVTGVETMPARQLDPSASAGTTVYAVSIRATSHSRGRAQAEGGLRGRLYSDGTYLNVSDVAQKAYAAQHGDSPRLDQKIAPGESILSVLVFELPPNTTRAALTLDHGFTPGYFVIGESPFFHKPDIHELAKAGDEGPASRP